MERVYRRLNGRTFCLLREDFCGTAAVACGWVMRRPENRAWGYDIDRPTLEWAKAHRLPGCAPPRSVSRSTVATSAACAGLSSTPWPRSTTPIGCSSSPELLGYFRGARVSATRGLVFLPTFGGTEAMSVIEERRPIPASRSLDGERVPAFTYIWHQAVFNPIDHHLLCHIHFRFRDGTELKRAFTYDWRMWTLPELTDVLQEAGFARADVYVEGWNDKRDRPDEISACASVSRIRKAGSAWWSA